MELFSSIPLFGSIANALFIVCGALAGLLLRKKIPAKIMELPVQGMALFVVTLGVGMAIKTQQPLVVIASIALGSLIGELMNLEGALEAASMKLEKRIGDGAKGFSTGFITTSLIYCTGSMAVLGAFEEGLGGYPSLLLTKGLIDGLTSVAMAASLGFGVIFSAVPVFLYQGLLTLAAGWIQPFMSEAAVTEMSATGGLMLMGIGINLLGFMKIRVMNMLPGLVVAVILVRLFF
ncbi:DUF554 domain-containing protein [Cloacibacillus porcorum]|uniref:DUF554 domain-containing protein n=1 Tax=Cloacibacillus porcorum TaxID=1197717 RepID=UPI0023F00B32|nr:DUF554 domain-containing protein [Cloacibacillus porcorum]MDD7648058.1 DUF554 domain-containing protein [Cloacibacillus porcorum]MDY4094623.1 DUF554 domain-containing protein [Cloacibacillus porcorum]